MFAVGRMPGLGGGYGACRLGRCTPRGDQHRSVLDRGLCCSCNPGSCTCAWCWVLVLGRVALVGTFLARVAEHYLAQSNSCFLYPASADYISINPHKECKCSQRPFHLSSPLWSTLEMHVVLIGILGKPQTKDGDFAAQCSSPIHQA